MSENEIKENNKLIAKFMGWTVEKNCFSKTEKYGDKLQNERGLSVKNRDYHSDWNLLMQVVEKIEDSESISFPLITFRIQGRYSNISVAREGENLYGLDKNVTGKSKIDSVYISIIHFLKWYNAQRVF